MMFVIAHSSIRADIISGEMIALRSLLLLVVVVHRAWALDPSQKLRHYGYSEWQDRDGLPQNTVRAIAQTREGYLWLGTDAGLARFNGREFTTFDSTNTPELRSNSIAALLATPEGGLWIGTGSGLLFRTPAGAYRRLDRKDGLPSEAVRALAFDRNGRMWVGTNSGVVRWDGRSFTRAWTQADGLPSNGVRSLFVDGEDVWIGTGEGLCRWSEDRIVPGPAMLPRDTVRALLRDRAGRLWVGMEASGLHRFEAGRHQRVSLAPGAAPQSVRALLEDRDGNLWIATVGGGLSRWREGAVETLRRSEGLASDHLRSLFEDAEGSLWVGTEAGGLAQLRKGRVITYGMADGLRSDFVRAIRGDALGNLWVGTEGAGLHRWTGAGFVASDAVGIANAFVTSLSPDRHGNLWIGTEGNGAVRTGPSGRLAISTAPGLAENSTWAIQEASDGSVWLATSNGLVEVKGGKQRIWRTDDGLQGNSLRALHAARDGSLWIGIRTSGLQRLHNGKFEKLKLPPEMRLASVNSILEGSDGRLWIATSNGLLHWDGREFRMLTSKHGLAQDNLFQVLEDKEGRLWFSGLRGIFSVDRAQLSEVLSGRRERVESEVLTLADGLRTMECSGDAHPAGWRTPDGDLWFATIRGVVRIRPEKARGRVAEAPAVVIEQVLVNGEQKGGPSVVSPPGNRLFAVRFAAMTYLAPKLTRYRYRLIGVDSDWLEATGRQEVVYHGIGPGKYRFELEAAHPSGPWSKQPAVVHLEVQPYFYESAWFHVAMVLATGVVLTAAYRWRTRNLTLRFQAVIRERARIAREIHDTLMQGFAGAALQLGSLRKRMTRDPEAAKVQLDHVLDQIDSCLAEARREIVELRGENIASAPFAERLRRVVEEAAAGLSFTLEIRGKARSLSPAVEKNLLRIAREAVGNASRHAQAQHLKMQLVFGAHAVSLIAEDDGIGTSGGLDVPGHFGLKGMRERAEEVGGRFQLHSAARKGTCIEVKMPVGSSS
jgi:ligand-binding sensor domain-containing protein/signal transduction histidine kinase